MYVRYRLQQILLGITLSVIVAGCGGGGSKSASSEQVDTVDLENATIVMRDQPTLSQPLTLTLVTHQALEGVDWSVVSSPDCVQNCSHISLSISPDQLSVTLTPELVGTYKIAASSVESESNTSVTFTLFGTFDFDAQKVEGYSGVADMEQIAGIVKNQVWFYSETLDEHELRDKLTHYPLLEAKGYDKLFGLLVSYDDQDDQAVAQMQLLKHEEGIDDAFHRVYIGEKAIEGYLLPNDYGDTNASNADNWHLEKIEMPQSWEFTTGSRDFLIGICDSGFSSTHEDLDGRFGFVYSPPDLNESDIAHGTQVAGAIAATANNSKGISGINWTSQLSANRYGSNALRSLLHNTYNDKKVLLANNSYGYKIDDTFDPTDANMTRDRLRKIIGLTRNYRALFQRDNAFSDRLGIFAAGNGVGNGTSRSGYFGVDAKFDNGAIHLDTNGTLDRIGNVIVVAAMQQDGRLAHYSDYGESVDIAAPTGYRSTDINSSYRSFTGTSAAAPVVTGVASLIYALYPGFTPQQVKAFLLQSSLSNVTERYKTPDDNVTENLEHPIPVLNAKEALKNAQENINELVNLSIAIPKPFSSRFSLHADINTSRFRLDATNYDLNSSLDNAAWFGDSSGFLEDFDVNGSLEINYDFLFPYHDLKADIIIVNTENNYSALATKQIAFQHAPIKFTVTNANDDSAITDVDVTIENRQEPVITDASKTDDKGVIWANVLEGTYDVAFYKDGYDMYLETVTVTNLDTVDRTIKLLPEGSSFIFDKNACPPGIKGKTIGSDSEWVTWAFNYFEDNSDLDLERACYYQDPNRNFNAGLWLYDHYADGACGDTSGETNVVTVEHWNDGTISVEVASTERTIESQAFINDGAYEFDYDTVVNALITLNSNAVKAGLGDACP